jgi:hypothetical protein
MCLFVAPWKKIAMNKWLLISVQLFKIFPDVMDLEVLSHHHKSLLLSPSFSWLNPVFILIPFSHILYFLWAFSTKLKMHFSYVHRFLWIISPPLERKVRIALVMLHKEILSYYLYASRKLHLLFLTSITKDSRTFSLTTWRWYCVFIDPIELYWIAAINKYFSMGCVNFRSPYSFMLLSQIIPSVVFIYCINLISQKLHKPTTFATTIVGNVVGLYNFWTKLLYGMKGFKIDVTNL